MLGVFQAGRRRCRLDTHMSESAVFFFIFSGDGATDDSRKTPLHLKKKSPAKNAGNSATLEKWIEEKDR